MMPFNISYSVPFWFTLCYYIFLNIPGHNLLIWFHNPQRHDPCMIWKRLTQNSLCLYLGTEECYLEQHQALVGTARGGWGHGIWESTWPHRLLFLSFPVSKWYTSVDFSFLWLENNPRITKTHTGKLKLACFWSLVETFNSESCQAAWLPHNSWWQRKTLGAWQVQEEFTQSPGRTVCHCCITAFLWAGCRFQARLFLLSIAWW